MKEQAIKKRDWIKNAMIVFLIVLLILTFFSNTIMNYSLPEVSAQYTESGTIQAKVRGNGVVEAGDPYTVKAESSKVIESVAVRNGDHVEKGDVLLYLEAGDSTELKEAEKTLNKLLAAYQQAALAENIDPETTNQILSGKFTPYNTFKNKINALKTEIKALEEEITIYEVEIAKVEKLKEEAVEEQAKTGSDHSALIAQYTDVIRINQEYVNQQKETAMEKQSDLSELLNKMSQESSLSQQLEEIQEQRELITKLQTTTVGGNIVAPITGTVQNLFLTAGQSTTAGNEVAMILPDGKGYTMEVSVSKEQAQRLNVGDVADIQNSWYYSDVTAVLRQIKADKSDPAGKKILVFQVEGDVSDGQSLSISIGQKSAQYDIIVPNSAIREDSNGKFILIVSQKSSPLGNRYYAERVNVEVLGSDDTKSAIAGEMESWAFVITTSTKPVEAGQLIRLAD